jgi:hypothetical protein
VLLSILVLSTLGLVDATSAGAAIVNHGGWRYVTKQFDSVQPGPKTLTANCPDGTNVFSGVHYNTGGFGDLTSLHSYPFDDGDRNVRPDDGWRTRIMAHEALSGAFAYAVCAKPRPRYFTLPFKASTALQRQQISVNCPNGFPAIYGGTNGPASVREVESYPGPPFVQWNVAVENHGSTGATTELIVICSQGGIPPLSYAPLASDTVPAQTQGFHSQACLSPDIALAGSQDNDGAARGDIVVAAVRPSRFGGPATGEWEAWLDNHHATSAIGFRVHILCTEPLT